MTMETTAGLAFFTTSTTPESSFTETFLTSLTGLPALFLLIDGKNHRPTTDPARPNKDESKITVEIIFASGFGSRFGRSEVKLGMAFFVPFISGIRKNPA